MNNPTTPSPPVAEPTQGEIEARMKAEFDAWFARLQELSSDKLNPEDWTARWFDGYTPTDALAAGVEGKTNA